MTTRAAAVATSQRAKQHLVNLLFRSENGGKGRSAHSKLDFASYSYLDLKTAYLKQVQKIHPDKAIHLDLDLYGKNDSDKETTKQDFTNTSPSSSSWNDNSSWKDVVSASTTKSQTKGAASAFIELQEAWANYDKVSKQIRRGRAATESQMRGVQEDFTAFGVGCSFSDSAEESKRRADIMDQAGKGFILAGQLGEGGTDGNINVNIPTNTKQATGMDVPLVEDDLFSNTNVAANTDLTNKKPPSRRKSLVDHLVPKFKRTFR